jgi:hypothetical protein
VPDTQPDTAAHDLLHEIADHLESGEEFHRGRWVKVAPLLGPALRWRRKAWVEGVEISREVIARQIRDVADWHWSPDVS